MSSMRDLAEHLNWTNDKGEPEGSPPRACVSAFVSSGGRLVAAIKMVGSYSAADHITSGISGNVAITDPMVVNGGGVQPAPAQTFPRHGIDLPGIAFGAQKTLAYAENNADAGGTLTVTDGRHAAAIAFLGNYMATSFVTAADGHGGTLTTEGTQTANQLVPLTTPHTG
jgi:hypothetical protein